MSEVPPELAAAIAEMVRCASKGKATEYAVQYSDGSRVTYGVRPEPSPDRMREIAAGFACV